ncbi:protein of unknown function DUF1824 [Stanieria cyanosphaera PCC 7437]|uniref:DUF1824 domain-containing protein n=1 Tax=Stanieria cyanosphaera (strain ATCC 29371 / PCC 7437) TaxID=111780 RepID=K9XRY6_STAC7|nr:DUF1824 family protein [Stanieria cyanosphaera]AFZ34437.1 protein of unknown function DUF1824 [Stanieria cyanosphaera PCC 7437]
MSESISSQLTLDQAVKLLKRYSCLPSQTVESQEQNQQLRQALLLVTSESEWENLGICAENTSNAIATLRSYLQALGYNANLNFAEIPSLNESVYLKFNTQKMSYYVDRYTGEYRGVLISCQGEQENIIGTYGYFPLDLFG